MDTLLLWVLRPRVLRIGQRWDERLGAEAQHDSSGTGGCRHACPLPDRLPLPRDDKSGKFWVLLTKGSNARKTKGGVEPRATPTGPAWPWLTQPRVPRPGAGTIPPAIRSVADPAAQPR